MRRTPSTMLGVATVATLVTTPLLTGAAVAAPAAKTGPSSSDSPYLVRTTPGVTTTSVLTVGDQVGGYSMVGIPDGLGAFPNGDGTFTVLMNHELRPGTGAVRDHGADGAFVSAWTVRSGSLEVVAGEDLVKRVYSPDGAGGWTQVVTAFNRLCSADLADRSAFYDAASGRGTLNRIFLNGEEAGAEGRAFGHVVTGPDAGSSYELVDLGNASWENQVAMPGSGTSTVVVGLDDSGGGQLYVYVGEKQTSGNDVERAGLTGGTLYGVKVDGVAAEDDATSLPSGGAGFELVEIPGAAGLTGAQLETVSNALGVTKFARPEDGAFDPTDTEGFYFATTASFEGISRLWHLSFDDASDVTAGGVATVAAQSPAYDASDERGPRMMDNLTVDDRGHVLVQEDPGGEEYLAGLWQYDPRTGVIARVAVHDPERFLPSGSDFRTTNEESSGIIPAPWLGRGTYLADVQVHTASGDPETVEQGQLVVLSIPPGKPVR